jgi:hypothetical protein
LVVPVTVPRTVPVTPLTGVPAVTVFATPVTVFVTPPTSPVAFAAGLATASAVAGAAIATAHNSRGSRSRRWIPMIGPLLARLTNPLIGRFVPDHPRAGAM